MKSIKDLLKHGNIIGLSPMDGITDVVFRQLLAETAPPDLYFTEFVSAEGLCRGGIKLFDHLLFTPQQRPIIGQLFGKDPDSFYLSALILCFLGVDGIDVNLGCPAKTVVHHGGGAALIGNPELTSQIIQSVQSAVADFSSGKIKLNQLKLNQKTFEAINNNRKLSDYRLQITDYRLPTISVKTRLGLSESIVTTWIPHLLQHHLDFITLHGRTLKQGYSGLADWQQISLAAEIVTDSNTKLIGNGDIKNRQQGTDYCQKYGISGVLIGRASLGNPWVFSDHSPTPSERFSIALKHFQLFQTFFPARSTDSLRRHFLAYASGLPHAKQLRSHLIRVSTLGDLLALENDFLKV